MSQESKLHQDTAEGRKHNPLSQSQTGIFAEYIESQEIHPYTVPDLFRQRAQEMPDKIAVVFKDKHYTYREVDSLSDRIAAYINSKGLGLEDVVSILIPRCEWMAIASLGVLKAGCAYQPLDPTYPKERLNFMMQDAGAKLLIADEELRSIVDEYQGEVMLTKDIPSLQNNQKTPKNQITPNTLFILLYTSGSTGVPKGCMLEHRNVVTFCDWYRRYYDLQPDDHVAAYASYGFDACMMDMYPALTTGATVYIISEEIRLDLIALNDYFEANHITHAFMTTQVGCQFAEMDNHSLKHLSVGGESFIPVEPPTHFQLHNGYGPTECTVFSTIYPIQQYEKNAPIGKPLDSFRAYVVDQQGQLVENGQEGELWLSGPQVGRGYLNRPEQTAQTFIANPFVKAPSEGVEGAFARCYRTGDIVRWLPDGNLQFIGRRDGQVKIRGFRIEMREVESVIKEFPGIKDVTVQAFDEEGGGKYIAAYIVSDEQVDTEALNNFILERKPPYMVPAATMQIERIPLNQNQKVDKRALPKPEKQLSAEHLELKTPQNELQRELTEMIGKIVHNTEFGIDTPLRYVGLTSISAIRLAATAYKRYGVALDAKKLVKEATVLMIEEAIKGSTAASQERVEDITVAPLSFSQTGVYIDCVNNPEDTQYNIPWMLGFPADTDTEQLRKAILTVLEAHKHIFVHFETEGEDIVQRYSPVDIDIPILSLTDEQLTVHKQAFVRPFDLSKDVLCRMEITKTESGVFLLLDIHHLVFDGSSLDLFIVQLCDVLEGKHVETENYTHLNHAADEQKESIEAHKAYYDNLLAMCEGATELQSDLTTPHECEKSSELYRPIDLEAIEQFCREHPVTPAHLTLAATLLVFARFTGNEDLYVSTVSSGRSNIRIQNTFGMFVNTLPFAAKLSDGSVMDFIKEVSERFDETMRHEQYPFARIAADYGYTPELAFAYQLGMVTRYMQNGHEVSIESLEAGAPKFSLIVRIEIHDGQPSIVSEYNGGLYSESLVSQLTESIANVLKVFINQPHAQLTDVSLLSAEQTQLLDSFNANDIPYDETQTVVSLFKKQAEKTPDKTAVVFKDKHYTYREVDSLSDRIAAYINSKGLGLEDVVSILIPRSEWMVIASLGVLKAGCAYQPLDPTYPKERLNFMMQDAGAKLLIADEELRSIVDEYQGEVLLTKDIPSLQNTQSSPKNQITPNTLFILLYTSGSTGVPKGCQWEHRNVVAFIHTHTLASNITQESIVTAYASFGFDASVMEIYASLSVGAELHIIPEEIRLDLVALHDYFEANRITHGFMTTQVAYQFATNFEFTTLKRLLTGGEKLPSITPPKSIILSNAYGPTESVCYVTRYDVTETMNDIPIGKAVSNMKCYVVDKNGCRLPAGACGELWVSGPQVSRGYLNRPEKTAETFIQNPFIKAPLSSPKGDTIVSEGNDARCYRTGDIVRYLPDGNIQFVGRKDGQVKIRGFRIELKEVEAVIRQFPDIKDVTVQAFDETGGGKFIAAYIVSDQQIDIKALNDFIMDEKPPYMVPAATMQIDHIPLNQNQKVDKKALPKPEKQSNAGAGGHADVPMNILEKEIHAIVADIVNHEDFDVVTPLGFAGLTSIMSIKLAIQINKRFGVNLNSKTLVKTGSVQSIENEILQKMMSEAADETGETTSETQVKGNTAQSPDSNAPYPLSYAQTGVYVECMKQPASTIYNIPTMVTFPKDTDTGKLADSLRTLVHAHPAMSVHFGSVGTEIMQIPTPGTTIDIPMVTMSDEELNRYKNDFVKPFNLRQGPLYRFEIVITEAHVCLLTDLHHLIIDGGSLDVFLHQLCDLMNGKEIEAEDLSYAGFVAAEKAAEDSEEYQAAHDFFHRQLAQCEGATDIPSDLTNPIEQGTTSMVNSPLDFTAAEAFCRQHNITPAHLTFAAVCYTLARFTNNEQICMTTISNGRSNLRIRNTIGMFVNTLALSATIGEQSVMDFIGEASRNFEETLEHENYPFAQIAADYDLTADIMFAYQMGVLDKYIFQGRELKIENMELDVPKFSIAIYIRDYEGQPSVSVEYNNGRYTPQLMQQLAQSVCNAVAAFIREPQKPLQQISLIDEKQTALLDSFNQITFEYDNTQTIVSLFRRQVELTPDNEAVVYHDRRYTYREVDEMSERIAAYIVSQGLGREDVVSVLIPRSEWMVIASFGVLKASCAYQPLDPTYPKERLNFMMQDAGAKLLIADEKLRSIVDEYQGEVLLTKDIPSLQNTQSSPNTQITPESLFILLYTSGSTGIPKGCQLEHRNLVAFCHWYQRHFELNEKCRVAAYASYGFDACMMDIYPAITCGACVHIIGEDIRLNLPDLNIYFNENHITHSFMTTQVGYQFATNTDNHSLRYFAVGGEKLSAMAPPKNYKMFNAYGPTECTIFITTYQLKEYEQDIPIGKPLDNQRLYIVDKQFNRLPPGATGELWVSGPQVSRGYLNRPEKTAETFIQNPFIKAPSGTVDGIYARCYRTGDIVRYLPDGNIQFVGRKDGQVKIRGFRIELKEVEAVIRQFPGIKDVTVQAFDEAAGGKFIAAYIVSDRQVDIKELNSFIGRQKPPYMIPAATMQIDSIPLNQNQKVNRKALPQPVVQANDRNYVAPANATEKLFCEIFGSILNLEKVGALDNFFDLGGTSLMVTRVIIEADKNGFHIAYGDIFSHATPRLLAQFVAGTTEEKEKNGESEDATFDYRAIDTLLTRNTLDHFKEGNLRAVGNALLTGATGYLGIHVLKELIDRDDVPNIWCMVRAAELEKAERRLKQLLFYYYGRNYKELFGTRLHILLGDVTKEINIDGKVDTVFNCAAVVKHFSKGTEIEDVNIGGAVNCVKFCIAQQARLIHVSTYSTAGLSVNGVPGEDAVLTEQKLYYGQYMENQYVHSKFISERTVLDAVALHGLDGKVMRVGNLAPRSTDGEFQINFQTNSAMGRIRVFKMLGCYPYEMSDEPMEFSPINEVARSIVLLSQTPRDCTLFHPFNNHNVFFGDVVTELGKIGNTPHPVETSDFTNALEMAKEDPEKVKRLSSLLAYQDMAHGQQALTIPTVNQYTTQVLYRLGFHWSTTSWDYVDQFLKAIDAMGYFDEETKSE